jgi:hypothetical protein
VQRDGECRVRNVKVEQEHSKATRASEHDDQVTRISRAFDRGGGEK